MTMDTWILTYNWVVCM